MAKKPYYITKMCIRDSYLSKNTIQSVFLDDVQSFFDANDVRYVDNISVSYTHLQA